MADYRLGCGCFPSCTCERDAAIAAEKKKIEAKGFKVTQKTTQYGGKYNEYTCNLCGAHIDDYLKHEAYHKVPVADKPSVETSTASYSVTHRMIKDLVNRNDAEQCDLCYEIDSICLYHEGMQAGAEYLIDKVQKAIDV